MSFQNCKISGVGVSSVQYHAMKQEVKRGDPAFVMSPSSLKKFSELPCRWVKDSDEDQSDAQFWGNLIDCLVLTPKAFGERYAIVPETYTSIGMQCPVCKTVTDSQKCQKCKVERVRVEVQKPWRAGSEFTDGWVEERKKQGFEVLRNETLTSAKTAIQSLTEDDQIRGWIEACETQVLVTGEWLDEGTGLTIPVSALLDFVPRSDSEFASCLGDFKTARSVHPRKFERQAFDFGYHIQAAFDLDIFNAAARAENPNCRERDTWCFVAQESDAPYTSNLLLFGQDGNQGLPGFVEMGREARWGGYQGILSNYCKCLKSGYWPRYSDMFNSVQGWCVLNPDIGMTIRAERVSECRFPEDSAPEVVKTLEMEEVVP